MELTNAEISAQELEIGVTPQQRSTQYRNVGKILRHFAKKESVDPNSLSPSTKCMSPYPDLSSKPCPGRPFP